MNIKPHLGLLSYVVRHKYHVYKAGRRLGLPKYQLLIHDLDKFLPMMWTPYVNHFFKTPAQQPNSNGQTVGYFHDARKASDEFNAALLGHVRRSRHHWQHWVLLNNGTETPLQMPLKYAREMVADWGGAGRAQGNSDTYSPLKWYLKNGDKIPLHEQTRKDVDGLVKMLDWLEG